MTTIRPKPVCQICGEKDVSLWDNCPKCDWENDNFLTEFLEKDGGDCTIIHTISVHNKIPDDYLNYFSEINSSTPSDWIRKSKLSAFK